jgi:hypothetical protein
MNLNHEKVGKSGEIRVSTGSSDYYSFNDDMSEFLSPVLPSVPQRHSSLSIPHHQKLKLLKELKDTHIPLEDKGSTEHQKPVGLVSPNPGSHQNTRGGDVVKKK